MKELKGKKILFASAPADGHINPLTGLAKYLQEIGCDVRWYTSGIFKDKFEKLAIPHYTFENALDINVLNFMEMLPERANITDPVEKLNFDLINCFGNRAPEYYADIQNIYKSFPFDMVIADSTFSAIPLIKHKMNIPVIAIGIVPLAEDSKNLAPYGMALPPAMDETQRAEYANLHDFANNTLFKPSIDAYDAMLKKHGISIERSVLFNMLIKQSDLYLQIGTHSFEYERFDMGENIRFAGALMPYASPATERQAWYDERLAKYTRIVLVTQGTAEKEPHKLLEPALEAFKDTDTLIIVTTGGTGTAELREKYAAENVIIEDYIPFNDVMPYATVYITNGGYGGTLLSIKNKLPIVAAGVHEGKNEVCARIGYFDYGINLATETPEPQAIRDAVEKIMSDGKYKQNISDLSDELDEYDSNILCTNHIRSLLKESEVLQNS